jgi:hypothetical protein
MSTARGLAAPCRWCGQIHTQLCPAVRAMEFHPDGSVKRVEFVTAEPPRGGVAKVEWHAPEPRRFLDRDSGLPPTTRGAQ